MKKVPLTQGKFSLVDDEDYDRVMIHKWCVNKYGNRWYAVRRDGEASKRYGLAKVLLLHRFILDAKSDEECDHINGDGLDNRKCNLRIVTHQQNLWNQRKRMNTSSKYKGVTWSRKNGKWQAEIASKGIRFFLGLFNSEEEAAKAYDVKAIELHGIYAKTNFMLGLIDLGMVV